jgi:uncharacterized YccA/Bax inhibitor family protein
MALFQSSNPALQSKTFLQARGTGATMTVQGTVNKAGILIVLCIAAASWTWHLARAEGSAAVQPWLLGGFLGGFIVSLIAIFVKKSTPVTAPLYAVLEGFALGGISSILDAQYSLIAIQAVSVTFGSLVVLLALYSTGVIRATPAFVRGVFIATGAIACVYIVDMVLRLFGVHVPFLNDGGTLGIGISLFIVVIAALNLVIDFAVIEQGAQEGAPKYMEWYGAFGLMVTLVWLYMEVLRLLAKIRGGNR